jgi:5-methylcytosine-specific restriction endonuclease McrA
MKADLPADIVEAIERLAELDERTPQDWLERHLRRAIWGAVAQMPKAFRELHIEHHRREPVGARMRASVWRRGGGKCSYCAQAIGATDEWHVDHVVPVKKGGTSRGDNLVLACKSCNRSKGTKDAETFRASIRERA